MPRLDRAKALLAEAKKLEMTIIGVHVGGEARRGQLSDRFIQAAVPPASTSWPWPTATRTASSRSSAARRIPLDKVERISKAVEPLQKAFK